MDDTSKYLIRARVNANGVVERSDVVGAIFGQTEGLLGDDLDLRDLRQSQKVGRIDVEITSVEGVSQGHLTIATSLDKVETATLAASLETIERVGPCRAELEVTEIEDVRAAKRRAVVDRAKELLRTGFDDSVMSSQEILAEVREHVRVEDITAHEGLPAGPRVSDSDAIIVVEGRSDVLNLLKYGVKNAIAVEGTDVPDAVAELTHQRTVTAFLDGDRGGDLILEELSQVGDIDYVAFAPAGTSVEDLDHHQLFAALRNKVHVDVISSGTTPREIVAATDGSTTPAPGPVHEELLEHETDGESESDAESESVTEDDSATETETETESLEASAPTTIYEHATAVIRGETGRVRFLDADLDVLEETDASDVQTTLERLETVPTCIVMDTILDQRLLDVAADCGVERIVARSLGQFPKRPTAVRVHDASEIAKAPP